MNETTVKGDWNVMKGKAKQKWGELTDDDLEQIAGRRDELIGRVQRAYGKTIEEAKREVEEFEQQTA